VALTTTVGRLTEIDAANSSGDGPLRLRRSWPRDDRLLLEYERPDGSTVAGQWYPDATCGAEVAAETPGSTWVRGPGVVLQPRGCDRRLTHLAPLVAEPGAVLLVHRPERRAVVRRPGRRYAKVLPSQKAARALVADRAARATGAIEMPELLHADVDAGVLEWAEVPGRSLYDLLRDDAVPPCRLAAAGGAAGRALRALHDAPPPPGVGRHDSDAELGTAASWLRGAVAHSTLPTGVEEAFVEAAGALLAATSPTVLLHRDLHEKQVLIDGPRATLIDVDTIAVGEAALDVANLLVHLDLRVAFGLPFERAQVVAAGVLGEYAPSASVQERIPAHAAIARIRLACLYAFRPQQAELAMQLVTGGLDSVACRIAGY
jgi:hypothetical protein